jgi:hypothetical protein
MIITLTPHDIIKRCLWTDYKKFALNHLSQQEIDTLIIENQPTVISEEMAYAIGLLKCIETDNLIHRFNQFILESLQIKSNLIENTLYINKNVIISDVSKFKARFPLAFKPDFTYKKAISDLNEYIDNILLNVQDLPIKIVVNNDREFECLDAHKIKKLLSL